ncbi:uncharacterized protein L969DRAFT_94521 [Mixia osmundae IAM 14324]|uniref:Cytochrome P450 n=1 Tax=Mixia osmundae (strain CBS 9802 / IAM 14324 / JCM 22182 / KY 12970) TaxID=764103 RepID=G7E0R6_MIXOS|nr:uncharacterized protein L969DRAFT_94521 [Mixia osmundae IAM 14324]KEI39459.1 hypothetical protein L969DRAFT_94521 [Mixia osmundae IAM 14324]GAA96426.1 hypothetical protein E5Q_03093 [Mixia osmundae IAM 14324]
MGAGVVLLVAFVAWFGLNRFRLFQKHQREISFLAGVRMFIFFQIPVVGDALPPIEGLTVPNPESLQHDDFNTYVKYGWDCFSIVGFLFGQCILYCANTSAIKDLSSVRSKFGKHTAVYDSLRLLGDNVVTTDGAEWRVHRRVTSPAFSEANNELVFSSAVKIVRAWSDELVANSDAQGVALDKDLLENTVKIALMVFSAAAFGYNLPWDDEEALKPAPGHKLSFRSALSGSVDYLLPRIVAPKWAYKLPIPWLHGKLAKTELIYTELEDYLVKFLETKDSNQSKDLLSLLVASAAEEHEGPKLTRRELIGNLYVFLIAGHETSAHTLCFAFALLALYPDKQQLLFEEARKIWPTLDSEPQYSDIAKLAYTQAAMHETLRMYPPVAYIPKIAHQDTELTAYKVTPGDHQEEREARTFRVPKGTWINIDAVAILNDPKHWGGRFGNSTRNFQPERFIDTDDYRWNRDAFVAFSAGQRSCLGMKFAQVEIIVALAWMVRRFEISLPDEMKKAGETHAQLRDRVLAFHSRLTTTPTTHIRLAFSQRAQ